MAQQYLNYCICNNCGYVERGHKFPSTGDENATTVPRPEDSEVVKSAWYAIKKSLDAFAEDDKKSLLKG